MRSGRLLVAFGLAALMLVTAACGGSNDDVTSLRPQLAGTPLPTATAPPPTPVVCDVSSPIPAPAQLPPDVAIPAGYEISSLETDPHLALTGHAHVSRDPKASIDEQAFSSVQLLEREILGQMRATWQFELRADIDGRDYSFTAPDGRVGHLNIADIGGCPLDASVTYEFLWITPTAGN